jgi:hypothetical protein
VAATFDDLLYVLTAMRTDNRAAVEKVVEALEKGGKGGPSAPAGPAAPGGGGSTGGVIPDLWNAVKARVTALRDGLAERMDGVVKATGLASAALGAFTGTFDRVISSLGGGMTRFVQQANPAAVYRFTQAVENATSAVGRVLLPVLERFTVMVQQIGNAIESLSPQAKQLIGGLAGGAGLAGAVGALAVAGRAALAALGPVGAAVALIGGAVAGVMATSASGKALTESFSNLLRAFGSIIEVVTDALLPVVESALVPAFESLAQVMADVADGASALRDAVRGLMGLEPKSYDPSARTALATRPAQMGDLRGLSNRAYTSAYNSGSASLASRHYSEARRQTDLLREIRNGLSPRGVGQQVGAAIGGERGGRIGRGIAGLAQLTPGVGTAVTTLDWMRKQLT